MRVAMSWRVLAFLSAKCFRGTLHKSQLSMTMTPVAYAALWVGKPTQRYDSSSTNVLIWQTEHVRRLPLTAVAVLGARSRARVDEDRARTRVENTPVICRATQLHCGFVSTSCTLGAKGEHSAFSGNFTAATIVVSTDVVGGELCCSVASSIES